MPIYEYLCTDCERHFEKRQNVSDAPLTKCEECGGKLEKQWSLSGFQFKGEGWYVTDYSGKKAIGKTAEKNSGSESTASTESASNSTTESSATKASE
ncbi:MAG: zinc ribbon domain-containing protein [Pyrinomonadaceae bacterium]|nr:zinc ribbon domain-containing protein [Pyrinomonadaceae bacterium]